MAYFRSPRNVSNIFDETDFEQHLLKPVRQMVGETPLTEWLWDSCMVDGMQTRALGTPFVQGLKTGSLNPNSFGVFNLQDGVYCERSTEALGIVKDNPDVGDMKTFIENKYNSYKESPRNVSNILDETDFEQHLLKPVRQKVGGTPLTEWLWDSCMVDGMQPRALGTPFIQGLKMGSLNPNSFGVFNLQDGVYCERSTEALGIVKDKPDVGDMKTFIENKYNSYKKYTKLIFDSWHIIYPGDGFKGIQLDSGIDTYSKYELWVAQKMEPIYFLIAMLPCNRLWPWLGAQLTPSKSTFGVYEQWITENFVGEGYKKVEAVINSHGSLINKNSALEVYKTCMNGELSFFQAAVFLNQHTSKRQQSRGCQML